MRQPAALFTTVLALGVTMLVPGPGARAAPIAITACQTISQPGSYVLANDLTGGDCLVITASFVTINLAGFSISATTGITVAGPPFPHGIAVRNGSISAGVGVALAGRNPAMGSDGIIVDAADGSIVENLRVSSVGDGIRAKGIVRGNTVVGGNIGVGILGSGVVTDNYVTGFGRGTGISATGTVRGNIATDNAEGIHVRAGSTVIGNTAMNNKGFIGIGILADCPSNLTDNTAVNNGGPGPNLALNGDGCHNEDNVAP